MERHHLMMTAPTTLGRAGRAAPADSGPEKAPRKTIQVEPPKPAMNPMPTNQRSRRSFTRRRLLKGRGEA